MTRYHVAMWALGASLMSTVVARRGFPPELVALMLRMTLPIVPQLSDMLVALQASGPWHHLVAAVAA